MLYDKNAVEKAQSLGKPKVDPYGDMRGQAGRASTFANNGERGFHQFGGDARGLVNHLQGQMMGQNSQSAEQLRQGLQQNLSGQRAMAASARPGSAPMAARTAAMNAGMMGAGMSGQAAMAGIAERNAAAQSLGGVLGSQRGLELQAALGGRGQAMQGYGNIMQDQTQRYGIDQATPSGWERMAGLAIGGAGAAAGFGGK